MAFAISSGQLARLEPAGALPAVGMSTWPGYSVPFADGQRSLTYAAIYRSQPAVRTVVSFLARNVAQLGLHAYDRLSDTDRRRLHAQDSPLAALLHRPNPRTTTYRLINALVSDKSIYDDAYWAKLRGESGNPVGVRRLPPWRMEVQGPDWTDATGYRLHGSTGHLDFTPDQLVHFRGYNPDDGRRGCSPIEALRLVLAEEHEASRWRSQMWRNGARISGYIQRPIAAPEWSQTAKDRFRAGWQGQYAGDGPMAGGTPVLEDGMEFVPASVNPRDAQYVESRKLTREEVAAEYHVAPPLVGILDHASFSNLKEQHKQLYQDTLGPICAEIEQDIGLQLVPDLEPSRPVYVQFNIREKMEGSFDEQAAQLRNAIGAPYMTRNEGRALLNLPSMDDADQLIVPLNVGTAPDGTVDRQPEIEGEDIAA
jgi:HK97 family phage portal protein